MPRIEFISGFSGFTRHGDRKQGERVKQRFAATTNRAVYSLLGRAHDVPVSGQFTRRMVNHCCGNFAPLNEISRKCLCVFLILTVFYSSPFITIELEKFSS